MEYNFEGFPVIIYDENGEYITKTIIMAFNRSTMTISISGEIEGIERGVRLIIMIIHPNGVSEYHGIARELIYTREISLYKGHHRGGRAESRYLINTPAVVKKIFVSHIQNILPVPHNVCIIDISKSGVLVNSPSKRFYVGTILEISINIGGKDTLVYAKIIREVDKQDNTFDYGCNFIKDPHLLNSKKRRPALHNDM